MNDLAPEPTPAPASFRDRVLFTVRSVLVVGCCPTILLLVAPLISPSETVRDWGVGETLELVGSVLSGPLAFASSVDPSPGFAAFLLVCMATYVAWGSKVTKAITIFGIVGWFFIGLAVTFVDV